MKIRTKTELGSLIKAERERRGLTQQALSASIGVDRRWVNEVERARGNPTLDPLLRCLDELGLSLTIDSEPAPDPGSGTLDRIIDRARAGTHDEVGR